MKTAKERWPSGKKYDIEAIRKKLENENIRDYRKFALSHPQGPLQIIIADELYQMVWSEFETDPRIRISIFHESINYYPEEGKYEFFPLDPEDRSNVSVRRDYEDKMKLDQVRIAFSDCGIQYDGMTVESSCSLTKELDYDDPQVFTHHIQRILTRYGFPFAIHKYGNCKLFCGDSRQTLNHHRARPKFLFADPPFNIGHGYKDYDDNLTEVEYRQFTFEWIQSAEECLAEDGVMAIHVPDDVVPLVLEAASLTRIAWINWHYRFGQCHRSNWINSKAHCLVFAKNPENYTWNPNAVLVESDRASVYKDKRTESSATPGQRVPFDVWGIPSDGPYWGRVQGNNQERRLGHPNQLPEVYLERLIRSYTNPGDLVLDPFVGSGTSVVVAEALGRKSIGIDVSQANIDSAFERLKKGAARVKPHSIPAPPR